VSQGQKVIWLARRNFVRGSFSNLATIFFVAVNSLAFFLWYLYRFLPDSLYTSDSSPVLMAAESILIVCLFMNFLSLFVIFWLVNRSRYHEIGLLRGIGARRVYIFKLLLVETQYIVLCGGLLAVVLGLLTAAFKGEILQTFLGGMAGGGLLLEGLLAALAALASTAITASLAVLYPAFVLCRIEPYNALRNRD